MLNRGVHLVFVTGEEIGRQIWRPVAAAARNRGFRTTITDNPTIEGDFGFYCDDFSRPGNQRISYITVNGLDQDHVISPRHILFFASQRWSNFDYGILPGARWFDGWMRARTHPRANPRYGVFVAGWPKYDAYAMRESTASRQTDGFTVLYAPQIESDGKQSDVRRACEENGLCLEVKHWETEAYRKRYPDLLTDEYFQNLAYENKLVDGYLKGRIIDPDLNIFEALLGANCLVTDQSSVLYEAAALGVPTITVREWAHACGVCLGKTPNSDIAVHTSRSQLATTLKELRLDLGKHDARVRKIREQNFANPGRASEVIVDHVEALVGGSNAVTPYRSSLRSHVLGAAALGAAKVALRARWFARRAWLTR